MVFPMMCVCSLFFFTRRRKQKRALLVEKCGLKFPSHTKRHARNHSINFEKKGPLVYPFCPHHAKDKSAALFFCRHLSMDLASSSFKKKKERKARRR